MSEPSMEETPLFTCLSCSIAFKEAEEQRVHYRSDHHRYNMKRRVASLPPVSANVFNQKVLQRRAETAVMASPKGTTCAVCNKAYTTENAFRSHVNSKKHKENELKEAAKPRPPVVAASEEDIVPSHSDTVPSYADTVAPYSVETESIDEEEPTPSNPTPAPVESIFRSKVAALVSNEDDDASDDDEINETIDQKIAAARARLSSLHCLFCPVESASLEANLTHMSSAHSFFIPDADYLIDIAGLINYLGEKIAVGNVCIYCNGKGREFRTLDAVRKHMLDKSHCKIAYDTENARLEVSDFYDFSSSYPDAGEAKPKKSKQSKTPSEPAAEEWEDVDGNDDADDAVDEIVDEDEEDVPASDSDGSDSSEDELPDNQITYGDSNYELVLPSGARIGHRSMRRYYAQTFPGAPRHGKEEDPNSGAALVRRLLADKNSALVPRSGGFGAYGKGNQVVKARNRGEAREAGRHIREFRDQKRREDFKTRVGFIHNSQKHFRDPLLQ